MSIKKDTLALWIGLFGLFALITNVAWIQWWQWQRSATFIITIGNPNEPNDVPVRLELIGEPNDFEWKHATTYMMYRTISQDGRSYDRVMKELKDGTAYWMRWYGEHPLFNDR